MARHVSTRSSASTATSSLFSVAESSGTHSTSIMGSRTLSPPPPTTVPYALNVPLSKRLSNLQGIESKISKSDSDQAFSLMQRHHIASGNNGWMSRQINYKDANAVLEQISRGLHPSATPSLVLSLITEHGGNVSLARIKSENIIKVLQDKDQEDVRSNILSQAVRHCSDAVVYALAWHADAISVSQALPLAIELDQPLKVMILMAKGADASRLCKPFLQAVESGSDDLVEALLYGSTRGACQDCRNAGMVTAAKFAYERKACLLLDKGADVTFGKANALYAASRGGMESLAVNMAAKAVGSRRIDVTTLDQLVSDAYGRKQYKLVEACLVAGAKGPITDKMFVETVRRQQVELAGVFARHGASLSHDGGLPLRLAVRSELPQLLSSLLRSGYRTISSGIIGHSVSEAAKLRSPEVALDMMRLLLEANSRHDSVNESLILALDAIAPLGDDQWRASITHLLLNQGQADPNVHGGICFGLAIRSGWAKTARLLLQHRPSFEALHHGMKAVMVPQDAEMRLSLLGVLMDQVEQTQSGDPRRALMNVGLNAVMEALHLDSMKLILSRCSIFSETDFITAFRTATSAEQNNRWMSSEGLLILRLLLEQGVTGKPVADAFCVAVANCHREAVGLLSSRVKTEATFSKALHCLAQAPPSWCLDSNLWLIDMLLSNECSEDSVNAALLAAVKSCAEGIGSATVVEGILTDGRGKADVNFRDGQCFELAIKTGNLALLELLLDTNQAQRAVLTKAFATLITTHLEEKTLLSLLDALTGDKMKDQNTAKELRYDVNLTVSSGLHSLAACLNTNPDHPKLIRRLIKLGCKVDAEFQYQLYDECKNSNESSTALLLACRNSAVSVAVIDALIKAKANVNYVAPFSKTTPLILASKFGRGDIVERLLTAKATVTNQDCFGATALYHASRAGNLAAVNLLKGESPINDGSLHEASRKLHGEVVKALLEAKHDANFPYRGKTALQALCIGTDGSQNSHALEGTIQALHDAKSDPWAEFEGKNALFLSLENPQSPVHVTEALLKVFMWKHVNDKRNIFKGPSLKGTRKIYSATKYLSSEYYRGSPRKIHELDQVLKGKQAIDRYYLEIGPNQPMVLQPDDAVNMPTKVEEENSRRLAAREKQRQDAEDHNIKMQRKKEESELKMHISSRTHAQEEYLSDRSHQHKLYQAEETSAQKMDISLRMHAQKQQQSDLTHRHNLHQEQEKTSQKMMADSKILAQKEYQASLIHQQKLTREQEHARLKMAIDSSKETQKGHFADVAQQRKLEWEKEQIRQKMINSSNLHAQKENQALIAHQNKIAQQNVLSKQQVKVIQQKQAAMASVQRDKETGKKNMAFIDAKAREIEIRQREAQDRRKAIAAKEMKAIRER